MWNDSKIEKVLEDKLKAEMGKDVGERIYADYISARTYLCENIYKYIAIAEPCLTDHSEEHVENVLKNVFHLLGDSLDNLNAIEAYFLCLSVFFHDVGNINGRKDHNKKVFDIYDNAVRKDNRHIFERTFLLKAIEAHCGKNKDGNCDTLKYLDRTITLRDEKIRLQSLAAILRFADELAEGPQRTSNYLIAQAKRQSRIYHIYASITNINIDKADGRIVLRYLIDLDNEIITNKTLQQLLNFICTRALKLDTERQYTKYYSEELSPFKKTEISISFFQNGENINIPNLNKIELYDDFAIPNEEEPTHLMKKKLNTINIKQILKKLKLKK